MFNNIVMVFILFVEKVAIFNDFYLRFELRNNYGPKRCIFMFQSVERFSGHKRFYNLYICTSFVVLTGPPLSQMSLKKLGPIPLRCRFLPGNRRCSQATMLVRSRSVWNVKSSVRYRLKFFDHSRKPVLIHRSPFLKSGNILKWPFGPVVSASRTSTKWLFVEPG